MGEQVRDQVSEGVNEGWRVEVREGVSEGTCERGVSV